MEKKFTEENSSLKRKIGQMEKEVQSPTDENNSLKGIIGLMEKEIQKLTEEINLIKIRIRQVEANESMRHKNQSNQI